MEGFNRQGHRIPQVIVTLSPTGNLQAEVAGHNGSRQVIHIPPGQCEAVLHRILKGQALSAAQEAWAILQASRNHKPYETQLEDLATRKYQIMAAKRQYQLIESQVGVLPQVKTTKSGKAHTQPKPPSYNNPALAKAFASLL